ERNRSVQRICVRGEAAVRRVEGIGVPELEDAAAPVDRSPGSYAQSEEALARRRRARHRGDGHVGGASVRPRLSRCPASVGGILEDQDTAGVDHTYMAVRRTDVNGQA